MTHDSKPCGAGFRLRHSAAVIAADGGSVSRGASTGFVGDGRPIGDAARRDQSEVIALWHACELTRPWNDPAADFTRAIESPSSAILIVRQDEMLLGSVMVGYDGHRGWIYYLAVAPSARRRGLGRALMAAAERWLETRGAPKLQLMVREGNDAAAAFYAALGYAPQPVTTFGRFLDERA